MTLHQEITQLSQFAKTFKFKFSNHFERILKSKYLLDSELFTKIHYKLKSFLQQLHNKLKENVDQFLSKESQLCYSQFQLAEDAAIMIYSFKAQTVDEFIHCLKVLYGNLNEQAIA